MWKQESDYTKDNDTKYYLNKYGVSYDLILVLFSTFLNEMKMPKK